MQYKDQSAEKEVQSVSFMLDLKKATAQNHLLLESNSLLSILVSPLITIHHYYCYLALMKEVALSYEHIISNHSSSLLPGWDRTVSSIAIAEDLYAIDYRLSSPPAIKNFKLSIGTNSTGFLLAFMYVMEGSKLGGKVIHKNINRILGFSGTNGAGYIADYGFDTGTRWKIFASLFSNYIVKENLQEQTITGAKETFASIYKFFESNRQYYEI